MGIADLKKALHSLPPHHPFYIKNALGSVVRAPLVCLLLLFLWAANLYGLELLGLDTTEVLEDKKSKQRDTSRRPSWRPILHCTVFFLSLYGISVIVLHLLFQRNMETAVSAFYFVVFILLISQRCTEVVKHYVGFLFRMLVAVLFPAGTVSFNEVLFADALVSLSKVFQDIAVTILFCILSLCQTPPNEPWSYLTTYHDTLLLACVCFTSLPYIIRIRQCWVQFCTSPSFSAKSLILLNIGKYTISLPALWLMTFANINLIDLTWARQYALFFTMISSFYSLAWDVCMDWGLLTFTRGRVIPRRTFMFSCGKAYAIVALAINTSLRFTWAAKFLPFYKYSDVSEREHVFTSAIEVAEVFRRAVWNVLRIEWEMYQKTSAREFPHLPIRHDSSGALQSNF